MTPSTRSPRFHALDVWRGVVCLLVVLEHSGVALWSATDTATGLDGWVRRLLVSILKLNLGTPLFFVMSGFCIASCVASARRRGTSPFLFLARRLWRIFPPYWAALLGFVAVVAVLDGVGLHWLHEHGNSLELKRLGTISAAQWLGNLTLTETWRPLVGGGELWVYTRVGWSLCYQEQFYLVCFALLLFFPARYYRALAVATAAILGFRVFVWDAGAIHRIDGTFPVLWHEFIIGLVVYWRLSVPTTPLVRRLLELALVALLALSLRTELVSTACASAFALVLVALHRWDERIGTARWLDPMRAIGRRSYGLYLVHLPVVMLVNGLLGAAGLERFWTKALVMLPIGAAASVAVCWVFHRVIERHFLDLPQGLQSWSLPGRARDAGGRLLAALRPGPALVLRTAEGRALICLSLLLVPAGLATASGRLAIDANTRPEPRPGPWNGLPDGWHRQHEAQVALTLTRRPKLLFLGDSIVFNWGDERHDDRGSAVWRREFAARGAANLGISGDRTEHLLWRVRHGALRCRPAVAVVMIGTNNLEAGRSPEETARGIAAVVAAIRAESPETRVLLLGVLPRHAYTSDPIRAKVARVNSLISTLDEGTTVRVVDFGPKLLCPNGLMNQGCTTDYLHLTPAAYEIWAEALRFPLRQLGIADHAPRS